MNNPPLGCEALFRFHCKAEDLRRQFQKGDHPEQISWLADLLEGLVKQGEETGAPEAYVRSVISDLLSIWANSVVDILIGYEKDGPTPIGIEALAEFGTCISSRLEKLPEASVARAAEHRTSWPILVSANKTHTCPPESLGDRTIFSKKGRKGIDWSVPINRHAHIAYLRLEGIRNHYPAPLLEGLEEEGDKFFSKLDAKIAALPDLTKATSKQWGEAAFEYWKWACEGKIEKIPELEMLGNYREHQDRKRGSKQGAIKQSFCQAFRRIAPHDKVSE